MVWLVKLSSRVRCLHWASLCTMKIYETKKKKKGGGLGLGLSNLWNGRGWVLYFISPVGMPRMVKKQPGGKIRVSLMNQQEVYIKGIGVVAEMAPLAQGPQVWIPRSHWC